MSNRIIDCRLAKIDGTVPSKRFRCNVNSITLVNWPSELGRVDESALLLNVSVTNETMSPKHDGNEDVSTLSSRPRYWSIVKPQIKDGIDDDNSFSRAKNPIRFVN